MRVSVVIPAWNAAAFIEKTLDTVKAQTFTDYEVVVVDDGSADDTKGVVDRWLARNGVAGRCIRQANKKIAGARNTGMRAAQGDLIALLDHDDLWYPEKLATCVPALEGVDLVCHWERVVKDGVEVRVARHGPRASYEELLFGGNQLSPSAVVMDKQKALSIGGFREDECFNTVEDYDFWMRLSKVAKFKFIPQVLGEYQLVERAASRRVAYHHDNTESLLRDHFKDLPPTLSNRWRMSRRLASVHRSALGQLLERKEDAELARRYLGRMLSTFPFDAKNVYRALQWVLS